jgi:hypothetical protein
MNVAEGESLGDPGLKSQRSRGGQDWGRTERCSLHSRSSSCSKRGEEGGCANGNIFFWGGWVIYDRLSCCLSKYETSALLKMTDPQKHQSHIEWKLLTWRRGYPKVGQDLGMGPRIYDIGRSWFVTVCVYRVNFNSSGTYLIRDRRGEFKWLMQGFPKKIESSQCNRVHTIECWFYTLVLFTKCLHLANWF